ncbi:MAG: glucose-6-phosphate isomerase [Firmicutes bacterium]|nr:glucose-6-phosphate isomerase [Bacillota bacterium]
MANRITFDFGNMFASRIGEHGVSEAELERAAAALPGVDQALREGRPAMAWRDLPYQPAAVLDRIKAAGDQIRGDFDTLVILGIGGSALGSKALLSACAGPFYKLMQGTEKGCRVLVEDNVDPDRLNSLLDTIDLRRTAFHVISKSGNTVETMSQFIIVLELLHRHLGADYQKHLFITTDKSSGILKRLSDANGWDTFTVPDGVGGRFSVFCPVGLLTAAAAGLDIDALLAGCAAMDQACSRPLLADNPAYMYALLYTMAMARGVNISVVMPYVDALAPTAEWYCQLWAESLGKRVDREGRPVFAGQTPVRALGVTDQHSQIQLYTEGPFDKIITFLGVEQFRSRVTIPAAPLDLPELAYLYGHSLNELIEAERRATVYAVTKAGRMNNSIILDKLDEFTFGGLLYFFEVATAAAGELLHIDAFNQPGVEEGKKATFALMGREGYADQAAALRQAGADPRQVYRV